MDPMESSTIDSSEAPGRRLDGERGATTIEYTMVLGFMSAIAIYATIWLVNVLQNTVAVLVIRMAIYLTGFPRD